MNHQQRLEQVCHYIKKQVPGFQPKVGLVLGSGLGLIADHIQNPVILPYADIPGFPVGKVAGHKSRLVLGELSGVPVMCMQGRVHRYEGASNDDFKVFARSFKKMGCTTLIVTNASGSLHENVGPGSLVLITDQINFQIINPLMGENDDEFGPRFPPMDEVYHLQLQQALRETANKLDISLHDGVNLSVTGPCYETAAEIRAYKALGADIVNMSTVPEVIVAHHCGLRIAGLSVVTNYATGLVKEASHDHDAVLAHADQAGQTVSKLLSAFLNDYKAQF
jgi:xanthosine phosphorylase